MTFSLLVTICCLALSILMCFFPPTNRAGMLLVVLFSILSLILVLRDYSEKKSDSAEKEVMRNDIQNLKNEIAKLQKDPDKEKELASQLPGGYKLYGITDKQIVPSTKSFKGDIKIDWSAAKILSVTKDLIDVMLPDAVLPGNNILKSNTIRVKNKEGFTSQGDIVINGWATFVKVLKANESRVIIAVGYTKIR